MDATKQNFLAFAYKAENTRLKPEFFSYFGLKSPLIEEMIFSFMSILEKNGDRFCYTFVGNNQDGRELGPIYKDFSEKEIKLALDYSQLAYRMFNVNEVNCLEVYGKDYKSLAEKFETWTKTT